MLLKIEMNFYSTDIRLDILRERAYNLRWATVDSDVIPLTAADPDFPCCEAITDAMARYIKDRYLSYGPAEGLLSFRKSISRHLFNKRHVEYSEQYILPVDSAAFGIYVVCKSFLNSGDEAIVFDPVDFLFKYSIEQCNAHATLFPIPAENPQIDFDLLESLITDKTKLICLCNPINPSGKVFTKEELIKLVEIADKFNLHILSDEIWSDIVFRPNVYTSCSAINSIAYNRTIIVHGFSKSYGLAGLRIGYIAAPNLKIYQQLLQHSLHSSTIHGVNTLSQIAAQAALEHAQDWLHDFVHHLQQMRDYCLKRIEVLPLLKARKPEACYVLFINIKDIGMSSENLQKYLMTHAKVSVVPGLKQWFGPGAENYIRISFASAESILEEAFDRIQKSINSL